MPKRPAELTPPVAPSRGAPDLKVEERVELMMRAIDSGIVVRAARGPEPVPESFRKLKTV